MINLTEYIGNELLNESVLKARSADILNNFPGPFFGLCYHNGGKQWLPVREIEVESNSLFGEEADNGMCYCTLTYGSLCKTKQIPVQNGIRVRCKDNNGYNWMPSPELLADIVNWFGGPDTVTFDITDPNLKGVDWKKLGKRNDFADSVRKSYEERYK